MRIPRAVIAPGLLAAWLLVSPTGCASDCAPVVQDGWIRQAPPGMPMQAGFGRVVNPCDAPLAITGASSEAFGDVSVHETTNVAGISRMRAVPMLHVPPGGEALLAPGGLHLMLADPVAPLSTGDRVAITFSLRDGGTLRSEFEVR